jgi:hypothetical protein
MFIFGCFVAADRGPVANRITAVGSIKWLERKLFDGRDLNRLIVHRSQLPGADESTPLVAVSRAGVAVREVHAVGPEQLLEAWR